MKAAPTNPSSACVAVAFAAGLLAASGASLAAPVARADRIVLRENAPPSAVAVLANDVVDAGLIVDGELRISSPPLGDAEVDTRGTPTAADDRIVYRPPLNFGGQDVFSYQVCESGSGGCSETQLHVTVRPSVDLQFDTPTGVGFSDIELQGLRDLPDVLFRATPLAWATVDTPALTVDPTPDDHWDGSAGTAVIARTLPEPSDGLPQRWRVLVDARGDAGDIDVYLGVDANGNGQPDAGELVCTAAMSTIAERCELAIAHPGTAPVVWWVKFHNRHGSAQSIRSESFQVNLDTATDGTLVATGPGDLPPLAPFDLRVAWHDLTTFVGNPRLGYVRVVSAGSETGVFPVRIDRTGATMPPTALGLGTRHFVLDELGVHDRLFVDVPEGATELRVVINAEVDMNLYVGRGTPTVEPAIGVAPGPDEAEAASAGPGGFETVTIGAGVLTAGRWFVRIHNVTDVPALVTVQAFISADAPVVRPGSYFNPERSGHGVFLYPAADQWTGLWYTYFQDRTPTWYYLQAPAPGISGLWQSELYRAAWDGDSRELVSVGRVTLTPVGPDRFTWTYRIDGETGSETLQALGRGCPMLDGDPLDSSSTWFDPDKAGTGHSVQLFADYEYYASFVYDALGVPRFLTAERTSFGDADELIDLEQLQGFCPLCVRDGDPERRTIGVFARSYAGGTLEQVALAGVFTDGVPGTWSADDTVQPLGGPASLQGCAK